MLSLIPKGIKVFSFEFLEKLRRAELEHIQTQLDSSVKNILEIGGGSGFQAKAVEQIRTS